MLGILGVSNLFVMATHKFTICWLGDPQLPLPHGQKQRWGFRV